MTQKPASDKDLYHLFNLSVIFPFKPLHLSIFPAPCTILPKIPYMPYTLLSQPSVRYLYPVPTLKTTLLYRTKPYHCLPPSYSTSYAALLYHTQTCALFYI